MTTASFESNSAFEKDIPIVIELGEPLEDEVSKQKKSLSTHHISPLEETKIVMTEVQTLSAGRVSPKLNQFDWEAEDPNAYADTRVPVYDTHDTNSGNYYHGILDADTQLEFLEDLEKNLSNEYAHMTDEQYENFYKSLNEKQRKLLQYLKDVDLNNEEEKNALLNELGISEEEMYKILDTLELPYSYTPIGPKHPQSFEKSLSENDRKIWEATLTGNPREKVMEELNMTPEEYDDAERRILHKLKEGKWK